LFYDSSLQHCDEDSKPQRYLPALLNGIRPKHDFVISKRPDGSVLSLYGDDKWELWPYRTTPKQHSALNFLVLHTTAKDDIKWLLFILIYMTDTGNAGTVSPGSLIQYMTLLRKLNVFSVNNNATPCQVLGTEKLLRQFSLQAVNSGQIVKLLIQLLTQLFSIGFDRTGINVINESTVDEIRLLKNSTVRSTKQHPVIPPRIFSYLLTQYWSIIDAVVPFMGQLDKFIRRCATDRGYARHRSFQYRMGLRKNNYAAFFDEGVKEYKLGKLFKTFDVKSLMNLTRFLNRIQHTCKELIHAYSGMRDSEVLSLKIDCLHTENGRYGNTAHLLGETSKLVGQRKTAAWVTTAEIKKVLGVAQKIAKSIANHKGFSINQTPLIVSVSYLEFGISQPPATEEISVNGCFNKEGNQAVYLFDSGPLIIQENDIRDLERTNPLRAWREEAEFEIGKAWKTTSHQWRRSLAFYIAQSGMVSLPTLKRQLQHASREMSIYYCNGSGFSELFSDSDHFSQELRHTKPEADALAYIHNILLSDEPLKGSHGQYVERFYKADGANEPLLAHNRKKTISMFKNGEIAYAETALGACTSVAPCDKKLLRSITACVNCPRAVIKPSKLARVVERQGHLVNQLNDKSVEYRTEREELDQLLGLQKKIDNVDPIV